MKNFIAPGTPPAKTTKKVNCARNIYFVVSVGTLPPHAQKMEVCNA